MKRTRASSNHQRGSALVVVVLFAAGGLLLVSTLLTMATRGVEAESQRHQQRLLQAVLRAGIADAINELNRDAAAAEGYDPGDDGVGALLTGADGLAGIPVRSSDGRVLGRYRTTVEDDGSGRFILRVVAAFPDFEGVGDAERDARRQWLACSTIVRGSAPLQLTESPLTIVGDVSGAKSDKVKFKWGKYEEGVGAFVVTDPSAAVPAVNIADVPFHAAFTEKLDETTGVVVVGGDSTNPGSPAAGTATVSNAAPGTLSLDAVARMAAGLDRYVTEQLASGATRDFAQAAEDAGVVRTGGGAADIKLDRKSGGPPGTPAEVFTLPEGVYHIPGDLLIRDGVTIRGSGTLIVGEKLELEKGGTLQWEGEVIVAGDSKAEIKVKDEGTLQVDGVLAIEGSLKKAKLKTEKGSVIRVDGAALLLNEALDDLIDADPLASDFDDTQGDNNPKDRYDDDKGELKIKSDSLFSVNGLFLMLSNHIHFKLDKDARFQVDGSVAFVSPDWAKKGLHKFEVKKDSFFQLTWDPDAFEAALDRLAELSDLISAPGLGLGARFRASGYWEQPALTVWNAQRAAIDGGRVVGTQE